MVSLKPLQPPPQWQPAATSFHLFFAQPSINQKRYANVSWHVSCMLHWAAMTSIKKKQESLFPRSQAGISSRRSQIQMSEDDIGDLRPPDSSERVPQTAWDEPHLMKTAAARQKAPFMETRPYIFLTGWQLGADPGVPPRARGNVKLTARGAHRVPASQIQRQSCWHAKDLWLPLCPWTKGFVTPGDRNEIALLCPTLVIHRRWRPSKGERPSPPPGSVRVMKWSGDESHPGPVPNQVCWNLKPDKDSAREENPVLPFLAQQLEANRYNPFTGLWCHRSTENHPSMRVLLISPFYSPGYFY